MTNKEAIEHLKNINSRYPSSLDSTFRDECEMIAINLAIKALEERLTGTWVEHTDRANNRYGCNICGSLVNIKSSFCPWCGAKMEGDA